MVPRHHARLLLLLLLPCRLCLCSKDSTTAVDCYIELAEKVRAGLSHIDPYFSKLADGMLAWIDCWQKLNPETIAKVAV
jgi:hypothetical protein